MSQFEKDLPETDRDPTESERKLWQIITEQRICSSWKSIKNVRFFLNNQGTGWLTWLTGTVSEIHGCGCSYTIVGPNGRVYRRNRAHLKPICYDSSTFQASTTANKVTEPRIDSFQDPKLPKKKKTMCRSKQIWQTWQPELSRWIHRMSTQLTNNHIIPHHIHHHNIIIYLDHLHNHPQWNPKQRHPHTEAEKDTIQCLHSSDLKTPTAGLTPQLAALLELTSPLVLPNRDTSPLAPYRNRKNSQTQSHGSIYKLTLICLSFGLQGLIHFWFGLQGLMCSWFGLRELIRFWVGL